MMKENELRIGNKFTDTTGFEFTISGMLFDIVYGDFEGNKSGAWEFDTSEIKPILLNEENLLRLGFVCDENKMYRNDRICVNLGNRGTVTILGPDGGYAIPFQHENQTVHWMQNLYFAITGEELELKPLKNP